jgi:hypothetical protein
LIQSIGVLTAVTIDYIPQAVVTLKSAKKTCSFQSFYIFVADASSKDLEKISFILRDEAWIDLFCAEDLGSGKQEYLQVFKYYNRFEISQLAKYVGVKFVLEERLVDVCVFVDADTLFIDDVCPLVDEIKNKSVYLTPHLLQPSCDGNEHEVMIHGWINTGFSAFNKHHYQTKDILDWIINRVSRRAFLAPQLGLSGDQTWVSVLPILFHRSVKVSLNNGLNVAYWNLDKRCLTRSSNNKILAGKTPLIMFHFSGFDETNLIQLSKHSSIPIKMGSILYELCDIYREKISHSNKIRVKLNKITPMPCSKENLKTRIQICSTYHQIDIYKTMVKSGVFSRVGGLIDSILRKLLILLSFKA